MFGLGGKGAGADASFADADGAAAGDGAIDLGFGGSGEVAASAVAPITLGAIIGAAVAKCFAALRVSQPGDFTAPHPLKGMSGFQTSSAPTGQPGDPVHVVMTNAGDIAHGATEHLTQQFGLMPTGPNGTNSDLAPHLPGSGTFGGIIP
jgi:hypothetical protein